MSTPGTPRLLPWTGQDGKPCYLLTDREDSPLSRRADQIEALQLRMAAGLLEHARVLIDDPAVDARQLRFLSAQLRTALQDVLRVAQSRGARSADDDVPSDLGF
ncbi:hypothetical protein [Streptomyces lydicus]|uniref:hypothetical protein n=1 Tax=Streptomyces lydicus TaxID=47763 RepID=UPI001012096E|nr:hypothetical protein [Streptomyces lydicus]MCZ1007963.1 hypothetical protein [Streptomyces lydicus]